MTGSDIITTVTTGFSSFLNGTGEGIATFFEKIFTNSQGQMSVFAIVSLAVLGLGLAIGMVKALLAKMPG